MSFTSDYQNIEQYKNALKKRYSYSHEVEEYLTNQQTTNFEKVKNEIDVYSTSIRSELKGSLKFTFSYEKTVAARITIMKYINKNIRGQLKFFLDIWRQAAVQIIKARPKTTTITKEKKEIIASDVKVENIARISSVTSETEEPPPAAKIEAIYQKLSLDVYRKMLKCEYDDVYDIFKIKQEVLEKCKLHLSEFYKANNGNPNNNSLIHYENMKKFYKEIPIEKIYVNIPLDMTSIARRMNRRIKCWLYESYLEKKSKAHPMHNFKTEEITDACKQFLNGYKEYSTTNFGVEENKKKRNYERFPFQFLKRPLDPRKKILNHITDAVPGSVADNDEEEKRDKKLDWIVNFLKRRLDYSPTPNIYIEGKNDQFMKVFKAAIFVAYLSSNASAGFETEIESNEKNDIVGEDESSDDDGDEGGHYHKKTYKRKVTSKKEKDAFRLMLRLYSAELGIMFLNGLDIFKPMNDGEGHQHISYDVIKKEQEFNENLTKLTTQLKSETDPSTIKQIEIHYEHLKIISKVSDVLGSAIGYELHGSEFVKRLRSANVIESTSKIENEIITRNSTVRGFETTIRENISKVDHLKALESISKTKNNKYINLANNLQKTIDNMEIELKRQTESLKQHINKLEEIRQKRKENQDEFPRNAFTPFSYYELKYTDRWESLEQDDPRLQVISYDQMILSSNELKKKENVENLIQLFDQVNGKTANTEGHKTSEADEIESVISLQVWERVITRMLLQLYEVHRFKKISQIDTLEKWWEDRKEASEKLKLDVDKFENENSNKFDQFQTTFETNRTLYSEKHAYDSDFLKWMKMVLPNKSNESPYEGKVLIVSNMDPKLTKCQDIVDLFTRYGTILHVHIEEDNKNAKVCMQNWKELEKIMTLYNTKGTRKVFSLSGRKLNIKKMNIESEKGFLNNVGRNFDDFLKNRIDNHETIMKALIEEVNDLIHQRAYWVSKNGHKQLGLIEKQKGKHVVSEPTHALNSMINRKEEKKASLDPFVETTDFFFSFNQED